MYSTKSILSNGSIVAATTELLMFGFQRLLQSRFNGSLQSKEIVQPRTLLAMLCSRLFNIPVSRLGKDNVVELYKRYLNGLVSQLNYISELSY